MPKPASTRPAYKMLTCIYLCRTLLFFAPYADFSAKMFNSLVFLWGFLGMKFLIDYMKSDLEAIEILLEWCIKRWDVLKVWLAF